MRGNCLLSLVKGAMALGEDLEGKPVGGNVLGIGGNLEDIAGRVFSHQLTRVSLQGRKNTENTLRKESQIDGAKGILHYKQLTCRTEKIILVQIRERSNSDQGENLLEVHKTVWSHCPMNAV